MIPIDAEPADSADARLVMTEAALAVALAEAENLRAALVSSRVIGAAVGIVMARQMLTYDAAFEALNQESQGRNVKLRDIAEDVLLTGSL